LPFAATDEIKLGYSTTMGSFTIKIDQRCIILGQNVFIEDKFNKLLLIKKRKFHFTTAVGVLMNVLFCVLPIRL
jgi:hypothetical protein